MIYTVGYLNITRKNLFNVVKDLNAILVDIRYVPYSYSPFWKKQELEKCFFGKYVWIKELGNINYDNKSIEIFNIEDGCEKLFKLDKENIFLMCACQNFDKCHRKFVAEYLRDNFKLDFLKWDNE